LPRLVEGLRLGEWRHPHTIVSLGKGGVGKTTVSLRLAVELAEEGREVLVASLDPAGHLLEYLGLPGPLVEKRIAPRLRAVQYSIEQVAKRVAEEYALLLQRLAPALEALGGMGDVKKAVMEAPGFEEEVFLRVLEDLYRRGDVDVVVIDTPPTGVALRVVALPRLHTFWARRLLRLRERIVSIKYAIANAMGREVEPSDPVLDKLREVIERYSRLHEEITSPARTSFVVVATPEPLPVYEARVVSQRLRELGTGLEMIVANRVLGERAEGLGLRETEEKAIRGLEEIRCSQEPPASLALIAHTRRPPSSLRDVEALGDAILEVRRGPCRPPA
jgi:arsenite-transporting ATPase